MSDQGEKTCPLCAEEMDMTDQQLKPCRCGYQICVWCWHHIMDMAEKDASEGRCPACRTPYDKEKIVGMTISCERLASEANTERRKTQKSKSKPSEGRKQLTSVRVIQRNLVYIVGLPLNLSDEDLLQRKEYFGQYGKVLKVSMSRTASGAIQQFPSNTCSVYITYSKEEEAVRCIQSVHGFVLDGKSLKACFGTTKYCHAWLRNMPCNNPDCLYLHEIGCQEDSFTKDEIISAYTRVQQITGAANNLLRRSGSMLPPPVDDYCSNSSTPKPIVNVPSNVTSNTAGVLKSSPPNGSCGRSTALPAAASWGARASNVQSVVMSSTSNKSSDKHRSTSENESSGSADAVTDKANGTISSSDLLTKPSRKEENQTVVEKSKPGVLKPLQRKIVVDAGSKRTNSPDRDPSSKKLPCSVKSFCDSRVITEPSAVVKSLDHTNEVAEDDLRINNLSADVAQMQISTNSRNDHPGGLAFIGTDSDQGSTRQSVREELELQPCMEDPPMNTDEKVVTSPSENSVARSDWNSSSGLHSQMQVSSKSGVKDVISFDSARQNVAEVASHSTYFPDPTSSIQGPNQLPSHSSQPSEVSAVLSSSADFFLDSRGSNRSLLANGFSEKSVCGVEHSMLANEGPRTIQNVEDDIISSSRRIQNVEDDIISSILSLDFDPWDESLTSSQNLAKLLAEDNQRASSLQPSNLLKSQHNNQSRFSFARQDESNFLKPQHSNQVLDSQPYGIYGQFPKDRPTFQESVVRRDMFQDKPNGFASNYSEGLENFAASPAFTSYKVPVSRSQISAPPGFSAPTRLPPPGFSSHERMDHSSDAVAGTRLLESTTLLRNTFQVPPPSGNSGVAGDIEFMDPAILAVGRGRLHNGLENADLNMKSSFSSQLNSFENDARLQLLMHRSLSAQQSHGYHDLRDVNNFSSQLNDPYGIGSILMDQSQGTRISPFTQLSRQPSPNSLLPNGRWDRWNEVQGNSNLGMAELLRNERLGFSGNNLYNGFEESKFRMPSSEDLYNRTYRM